MLNIPRSIFDKSQTHRVDKMKKRVTNFSRSNLTNLCLIAVKFFHISCFTYILRGNDKMESK